MTPRTTAALLFLASLAFSGCGDSDDGDGKGSGGDDTQVDQDVDADADGYTPADGDCDDDDPSVHPDGSDLSVDGTDQDCDGLDGPDADGDGYVDAAVGGDDCDDGDPNAFPGAPEVWDDGLDQDCDGVPDVEDASCTADLELTLPDGSRIDLDGCAAWSVASGLDFDPDEPPTISVLWLSFNGVVGDGLDCSITIEQRGICGTGYYDIRDDDTSSYSIITSDCVGVPDAYEGAFDAAEGYLRLDALDIGELELATAGDPLDVHYQGAIRTLNASGLSLTGTFDLSSTAPTQDVDTVLPCEVEDGDADADGYIAPYFDGEDCDDRDASSFPGAWTDSAPTECMVDEDRDGYGSQTPPAGFDAGTDCDDDDVYTYVGAAPTDSPTACMTDADGDDYGLDAPGAGVSAGSDCDDADADVNPAALDVSWDFGVDDDCDGSATPTVATFIDVGWFSVCAIVSGEIRCHGAWGEGGVFYSWEYSWSGGVSVIRPPAGTYTSIDSGFGYVCGIESSGLPKCGGRAIDGVTSGAPSTGTFESVSAGWATACALDTSGSITCWGNDDYGQVTDVPSGTFETVEAGGYAVCALDALGAISCWGHDYYDQVSGAPSGAFESITLTRSGACAMTAAGAITCWGEDSSGLVSDVPSGSFESYSTYSSGLACALDSVGALSCWGDDTYDQVSDTPAGAYSRVGAAGSSACAIDSGGELDCWGRDSSGSVSGAPAGTWQEVSMGTLACALGTGGAVECWGGYTFTP